MQRFFAGCVRSVRCWKNYNQFATTSKHQYSYQSEVEEKVILQGPLFVSANSSSESLSSIKTSKNEQRVIRRLENMNISTIYFQLIVTHNIVFICSNILHIKLSLDCDNF